ncbi:MAG TPA: SRPBCC family protein [Chitinophagales bacterium]|nr:SRPBCC family protein [Chitinophagales bacterium]HMW12759.1 SRPBCC family protein [Chitinophagales bacterium]HMX60706.1 SRPBCC family protein [Chitinophagales bacterium]HMY23746.1 SRPBCC family protein [Chitinophagales bacterium]HMZ34086.1 SRPBCC family protein [Chitinophagales bacterium]
MPVIQLTTEIAAPIDICFDLSRSIDLHKYSMKHTNEEAVAGRTSGLIEDGETVTWQAKHLGVTQYLSSKISNFKRPFIFRDSQTKGIFDFYHHDHIFEEKNGKVVLIDIFEYKSPFGIFGIIADMLYVKKYMIKLLQQRNQVIKEFAESDKWKSILSR